MTQILHDLHAYVIISMVLKNKDEQTQRQFHYFNSMEMIFSPFERITCNAARNAIPCRNFINR